jgi:2-polyprenyl-3-methyl-5-hydroxy-6-metoxy-1,4-benzoquinol methylase
LDEHIGYFADPVRVERFRAAVAKVVRPGDLVADVGCGSGILGLLCLQAGAARVWGIDSTSMIEAARETFARAGLEDRYVCIRGNSQQVELLEKVDVAICDHVGFFGFDYDVVETLRDAQQRFLKPGGRLIPSRIKLMMGLVQSDRCRKKAEAWGHAPVPSEMHWLRSYGVNSKHAIKLEPSEILGMPAELGVIDLTAENPELLTYKTDVTADRDGVVDGLGGWFDCELADGVWMTNSPVVSGAISREQAFLPIETPLRVKAGDILRCTIQARPSDDLISWTLEAPASGQRFNHSTWKGTLLAAADIVRGQPERIPRLSRTGQARRLVLAYCDGHRSARDIEQAVLRDHPNLFPSQAEIVRFVSSALAKDTE